MQKAINEHTLLGLAQIFYFNKMKNLSYPRSKLFIKDLNKFSFLKILTTRLLIWFDSLRLYLQWDSVSIQCKKNYNFYGLSIEIRVSILHDRYSYKYKC